MDTLWLVGTFIVLGVLIVLYNRFFRKEPEPPTEEELAPLRALSEELRLPLAEIVPGPAAPSGPLQSRIGGPFWRPDGVAPPRDSLGNPLLFLAQVNFAETGPLPDFPAQGLLQLFAVAADSPGAVVETGGRKLEFLLDWWPEAEGGGLAAQAATKIEPFLDRQVFRAGRAVSFKAGSMGPTSWDWRVEGLVEKLFPGRMFSHGDTAPTHYLGGHPDFWQYDPRNPALAGEDIAAEPMGPEHDRVLLHIGSDETIEIGDSGMINVLIPAEALRRRDFAAAVVYWDCA